MTRHELCKVLRNMEYGSEIVDNHIQADSLVADFLRQLGYGDVADAYDRAPKWYK